MPILTPAQIEDREYVRVDLSLPVSERCGAPFTHGRTCSRRANHVNERHRDGEISWTDAMASAEFERVRIARDMADMARQAATALAFGPGA
jgi:hypothetical protein